MLASTYFNGYVSDIELVWTLIGLSGLIFSLWNARESVRDIEALKSRGITNGRMKIAKMGLKSELARAAIQSIFVTVGIFAMNFQDTTLPHEPLRVAIFRFVFQWGFIISASLLALKSYWSFQLRRDLLESGVRIEPHELDEPPQRS